MLITLMPSCAFAIARLIPVNCAFKREATVKPAASSPARLILRPDDKRSIDLLIRTWVIPKLRCALMAPRLLLTRLRLIVFFLHEGPRQLPS